MYIHRLCVTLRAQRTSLKSSMLAHYYVRMYIHRLTDVSPALLHTSAQCLASSMTLSTLRREHSLTYSHTFLLEMFNAMHIRTYVRRLVYTCVNVESTLLHTVICTSLKCSMLASSMHNTYVHTYVESTLLHTVIPLKCSMLASSMQIIHTYVRICTYCLHMHNVESSLSRAYVPP